MQETVGGVPYVQVVLPLPVCAILVGAIETTLMENSRLSTEKALEPAVVEILSQTREFFEDVHTHPRAFPVTGKMATGLKKRARIYRGGG